MSNDLVHIEYWPGDDFELFVGNTDDAGNPLDIPEGASGSLRLYKDDALQDTIAAGVAGSDYTIEADDTETSLWDSEAWTDYTFRVTVDGKTKTLIYGALRPRRRFGRG